MNISVNKKVSFCNGKTITDNMIMNHVGVVTYTYLCRKFPSWFYFYNECKYVSSPVEGNIPSEINLYISDNPFEVKRDIILDLCGFEVCSSNTYLISSSDPPKTPLIENDDNFFSWIFICIVLVVSIFFAIYVLFQGNIQ